jgi:hypothetical protein
MANKVLIEKGVLLSGDTMMRQNPAWNLVKESHRIIDSCCVHFGLSPKSRSEKLDAKGPEKDALDKLLDD